MLICPKCNYEQESGKFCEACGQPFNTSQTNFQQTAAESMESIPSSPHAQNNISATAEHTEQTNQNVENVKNALGKYWEYFLRLLKNPSNAFTVNESYFLNGLITIALYSLLFSLGIYFYANSVFRSFGSFLMSETSLPFSISIQLTIFILIILAVAFFSAFAMIKVAKHPDSIKVLIAQFGSLLVPFTLLTAIGFVGGIIGSTTLTLVPIFISLIYSILFLPVLFVYEKASNVKQHGQKIYFSLATILIMSIAFYILGEALLTSLLGDLSDTMEYIL